MDFATRDRYRHVVEKIAKSSRLSEARSGAQGDSAGAAERGAKDGGDDRAAHVGFYLIDKGVPQLEQTAGSAPSPLPTILRNERPVSAVLYISARSSS